MPAELVDLGAPAGGDGAADAREDDVARDAVQLHVAAGGEEGEGLLDLGGHLVAGAAQEGAEAAVEAEFGAVVADEVQDGAGGLGGVAAEASAQLLEEQGRAVGRAEHQEGVDGGDVDALVEQVDGEHDVHASVGQVAQGLAAIVVGGVGPDGGGGDAGVAEDAGHEPGVVDAHAEAEGAHARDVVGAAGHLLQDQAGPGVVAGEQVGEAVDVVAAAAAPGDVAEVQAVVDAVVGEGDQAVLVDGVPQAQLGGDAAVEVVEHRETVRAFRRRGEPELRWKSHALAWRRVVLSS